MRWLAVGPLAFALLLSGCKKGTETQVKTPIQEAIETHLQQRPNLMLANMTLEVQDVKISGNTAEAEVKFHSKQQPDLVVGVRYTLRKVGNRWQVEASSPTSGMGVSPHGTSAPQASPAPGQTPLQSSH